jgi:hypothetical protein
MKRDDRRGKAGFGHEDHPRERYANPERNYGGERNKGTITIAKTTNRAANAIKNVPMTAPLSPATRRWRPSRCDLAPKQGPPFDGVGSARAVQHWATKEASHMTRADA